MDENPSRLHIILADSELEIVPREFWSHPAVVNNAKKRKKKSSRVLLESSLHYSLFKGPEERSRRGRPDLVYQFLLLGLDSIINKENRLTLTVHTRNHEMITISSETRLPKSYNRFLGLFEELYNTGAVPNSKDPLIELNVDKDLAGVVDHVLESNDLQKGNTPLIILDPDGEKNDLRKLMKEASGKNDIICIIGGFSNGDYRSNIKELGGRTISLPGGDLTVWTVVSELLVNFRTL